jgi:hypothetical protein
MILAKLAGDFNDALIAALEDKDYRCRKTALRLLAPTADAAVRQKLLGMVSDASAPVRETLAEVIAGEHWLDGAPVLAQLIHDTRDADQSPGMFRYGTPDYHVARTAAMALREVGKLDRTIVGQIIARIKGFRQSGKGFRDPDIGVPYELLLTLGNQEHEDIPGLCLRHIRDDWYVEGVKQSGYPIRYAAAWCLFAQLSRSAEQAAKIDPAVLVDGAGHSDGRLAGPCLMAIALCGDRAFGQVNALTASPTFTRARALIMAATLPTTATATHGLLNRTLTADLPESHFLEWAEAHGGASSETAEEFLAAEPAVAAWLDSIQAPDDVLPELRYALHVHFGSTFGDRLESSEVFPRHLPTSIPVLTMRSMFGGD